MSPSPLEILYTDELYAIRPKVLVIIAKPWAEVSSEEQNLLSKILGSIKLHLDAVQVMTATSFELQDIKAYGSSKIIAFGARLEGSTNQYEVLEINGISLIQADHLGTLDDVTKKSLWVGLKKMFGL